MNKIQALLRASAASVYRRASVALLIFSALTSLTLTVQAQAPDLTSGGTRSDNLYWNMGPTGMRGWFYHQGASTALARQIEVMAVTAGSPADGIFEVGDVILGADGTGAEPVNFTADARKSLAYAIADAEANDPAVLKLLRWRAGVTSTVTLALEYFGAYSATAPYNCPKSAAVLEKGLNAVMAGGANDGFNLNLLAFLAANDPNNPNNAARMVRAQQLAHELILTPEEIDYYTSGAVLTQTKIAWTIGFYLVALGEYYLQTGDAAVYDSLRAYAIAYANGQSMFGTSGHQFAKTSNGPYGIGYGVVNSANMQCFYGLMLAKEAGINDQKILDAIDRASAFYASYVDRGSIPYGEHTPGGGHESNGKMGIAALIYRLDGTRQYETEYCSRMAGAAAFNADGGHTGPYLQYLWAPLGANVGGEESMAAYFSQQSWRYDLARNWDGSYTFDTYGQGNEQSGTPNWYGGFQMYLTTLLTYAVPLRQTYSTGKYLDPQSPLLSSAEIDEVQFSSTYTSIVASRTTNELMQDITSWSPNTRAKASGEISNRTAEHASVLPTLHTMANDTTASLYSRMGAIRTIGNIGDAGSVPDLINLLDDPDSLIKWTAANALVNTPREAKLPYVNDLMQAVITADKPLLPLDPEDPMQHTKMAISYVLFGGYGGILRNQNLDGIDRNLFYPAVRSAMGSPTGKMKSDISSSIYDQLNQADMEALADVIVDSTQYESPADRMFSAGVRLDGLKTMKRFDISEGVPLAKHVFVERQTPDFLAFLEQYAASSLGVKPDPKIEQFCLALVASGNRTEAAQAVLDAIAADTSPEELRALKVVHRIIPEKEALTLPENWTVLRAISENDAAGDAVESFYTWRKVHGVGEVNFIPNGTAAAKDTTVVFDGTPGQYLFEVTMSDSRGLTEVSETVGLTLYETGGTLPANNPPTADAQSVTTESGTPIQIILTGSDPENEPLIYSVTSSPGIGTLTGTAPSLVYTAPADYTGTVNIGFEVMDSEGQTASNTVTITVNALASPVGLAIYEPFDYPNATMLNGLSGTTEIGFAAGSTWTAGDDIYTDDTAPVGFQAGGYTYGPLPTTGSKVWHRGFFNAGMERLIDPNALSNSGLLADGATLWFSLLIGADDAPGRIIQFAFANAGFPYRDYIEDDGADPGTGLGFTFHDTAFRAAQFLDVTQSSPLVGDFDTAVSGQFARHGTLRMVVGKITWGAISDTVEIYLPFLPDAGDGIVLPDEPSSTLTADVDQSKFDVLALSRGAELWIDEIRVGATLQSVVQGTVAGLADDSTAPGPDPMTFEVVPFASDVSTISMTATTAYDPLGVEYYFACTAGGGNDSGWQESPVYTDTGLTPGVAYSYTVKARDKQPGLNETAASPAASATIPTSATVPDVVGMAQDAAESTIVDASLTVGTITQAASYSETVPAGHVLTQTPSGNSSAATGSAVDLEISIGPDPVHPTIDPVDIVDNVFGGPVTMPASIIYTLTFSKDMDILSFDASDFMNFADMPITIGNISEIAPGVITVEVIPGSIDSGTILFGIAAGAVLTDEEGNNLITSTSIIDEEWISVLRPDNYIPVVDAGPDQTLTMNTKGPWSPASLSTTAWYDAADVASITADAGYVSRWDDKSGNNNHATQSNNNKMPVSGTRSMGGLNLIDFGRGTDHTNRDGLVLPAIDLIGKELWVVFVKDDDSGHALVGGSGNVSIGPSGSTMRIWKTSNPYTGDTRSVTTVISDQPIIAGFLTHDDTKKYVVNGIFELTQDAYIPGNALVPNSIGEGQHGGMDGAIGELIITSGELSTSERRRLEGYLAHKWGIEGNLPGDHPYKLNAPSVPAAVANLDGTVTDADGDPYTVAWSMISGPFATTFGDSAAEDTTANFFQAGDYTLRLTADDGQAQVYDEVSFTVGIDGILLAIDEPAMSENGGSVSASVIRSTTSGDLLVTLTSDDTSEATVPASVTILDGETSASFTITAQDDAIADGVQVVTITAASAGNADVTESIKVYDDEAVLTIDVLAETVNESDGPAATTGTVTRNTDTTHELVVNLTSSDTTEITVQPTVTIAAGETTSPAFAINAIDDSVVDGTQTVTLTAGFEGYVVGTVTINVTDDPSFTLTVLTGTGGANSTGGGAKDPDGSPYAITATPSIGYAFDNWSVSLGSPTIDDPSAASTTVSASADATVQANFVVTTHTVIYDGNGSDGGSVPVDGSSPYDYGSNVVVSDNTGNLTRFTYLFIGWNTAIDGSGTSYGAGENFTITEDVTLYAQWELDDSTLTYDGNGSDGGTVPVDSSSPYLNGSTVTVLDNTGNLVRTGHTFTGWNTASDGTGTGYAPNDSFVINANTILYAQWVINTYTMTYDGNGSDGGTVPVDSSSPYDHGSSVTVLGNSGNLTRTGFEFGGWNTAADGTGQAYAANDIFTIISDTILYAQWQGPEPIAGVDFENGSGGYSDVPDDLDPNDGITVSGWTGGGFTNDAGANSDDAYEGNYVARFENSGESKFTLTIPAGVTLDLVNVTFAVRAATGGGGGIPVSGRDVEFRTSLDAAAIYQSGDLLGRNDTVNWVGAEEALINLTDAKYKGLSNTTVDFIWTTPGGGGLDIDAIVIVGEIISQEPDTTAPTLAPSDIVDDQSGGPVLQDTLVTYTVTFSEDMDETTVTTADFANHGDSIITIDSVFETSPGVFQVAVTPTTPGTLQLKIPSGAVLNDPAGNSLDTTSDIIDDTIITITDPATLTYTVSYNGNGNTGGTAPADQIKTHGEDLILATNSGSLVKDGFAFDGWNTASDGSGTDYAEGAAYTLNEAVTLYARWNNAQPGATFLFDFQNDLTTDIAEDAVAVMDLSSPVNANGITLTASVANATGNSRDRGANNGPNSDITRDFIQWTIATPITITISGLAADQEYAFKLWSGDLSGGQIKTTDHTIAGASGGGVVRHTSVSLADENATGGSLVEFPNVVSTSTGTLTYTIDYVSGGGTAATLNGFELTTIGGDDTTAPTISTLSPVDDSIDVAITDNLVVIFDENIAAGSGVLTIKNLTDATESTIDITDGTQISITDATLTINPTSDLLNGKNYAVQIAATAIEDLSGNAFAGISDDTTWNFSTVATAYTVTYDGNGSDGGTAPADASSPYSDGSTVTVLDPGSLSRTGYSFAGWNTASDGSGISYAANETFTITGDTTLYAMWVALTSFELWAGAGAGPGSDSNGDGVADGLAWVLGAADPSAVASNLMPTGDAESDPDYYVFTYRRSDDAEADPGTSIGVIYGDDMNNWSTAVHDGSNVIITVTDDHYGTGVDRVEVKINWGLFSVDRVFTRLRVEFVE